MTGHLPLAQTAIPSQIPLPRSTAHDPTVQDGPPRGEGEGETADYTMKCICNFSGDDGSTIYCEKCDTWQHIGCFYPDRRADELRDDFSHFCHECEPRPLDRTRAIERVQALRNAAAPEESSDKKPKKPAIKSQRKKPKPSELHINGATAGHDGISHASPSDQHPPAKKTKTSHRPSQSISSQAVKRSPSTLANGKSLANGRPPSPPATLPELRPDFLLHDYSPGFLALQAKADVKIVDVNTVFNLGAQKPLNEWAQNPQQFQEDCGHTSSDVFQPTRPELESKKNLLRVERKELLNSVPPPHKIHIQYLVATEPIAKDVPLVELNGEIGVQATYCANTEHAWDELTTPLPFVFFHPLIPLYIDTRKEGSRARYIRRSCKPNVVLDTYWSKTSGFQFYFVSYRHISAKEQITLPWDFRFPNPRKARMYQLLGLSDDDASTKQEIFEPDDADYQTLSPWLYRVLSEYGGCACDLGPDCAFARFHRHHLGRMQAAKPAPKKKSRKPKTQNTSPTSTGQATNSRAPSEGRADDGADNDAHSTSKSKPTSRDPTPLRQGSFDQLGILTGPTDRDKRKVAMVEDSFRRMEQAPPRKKKRVSDGSGPGNPKTKPGRSANATPILPNGVQYVDTATSRSKSGSPASAISPSTQYPHPATVRANLAAMQRVRQMSTSPRPRPHYCDAAVQTDHVENQWFSSPTRSEDSPRPRRVISLSQKLMLLRQKQREERLKQVTSPQATMDMDSPVDQRSAASSPVLTKDTNSTAATSPGAPPGDMPMTDAPSVSPTTVVPAQPPADPDGSATTSPAKWKTPDLRVQMPPVPFFNNTAASIASSTTPLSSSSIIHSPFSSCNLPSPFGGPSLINGVHPSPVKKKLSLTEYRKSRMDKGAASKTKSGHDDTKSTGLESIADSPTAINKPMAETSPTISTPPLPHS